jgi:ribosomal protein L22
MVEEKLKTKTAKTEVVAPSVNSAEQKTQEVKTEDVKKTETVAPKVKTVVKGKEMAVVNGFSLAVSTKNSVAICKMIMKKSPERAIEMLELVLDHKMAVPMIMDEIPHRKRGLMPAGFGGGGRFPKNASVEFINLLKQLKANCEVNGIENPIITLAVSNLASRPFKKEGKRAKRTHVHMEAKDRTKLRTHARVSSEEQK